jgi:hypothetical protein
MDSRPAPTINGKCWEIIVDNFSKAGWSWGRVWAIDCNGGTIWIADAHRDDGKRFVVHADELLTAFVELEREVLTVTFYLESIGPGTNRPECFLFFTRYGSLKSPACSCVSITLPASS